MKGGSNFYPSISRRIYARTYQTNLTTCYVFHDIPTDARRLHPSIHSTRSAGQYRFELAKLYLMRRRDATDWEAAFLLLDQALEVLTEEESRTTVRSGG